MYVHALVLTGQCLMYVGHLVVEGAAHVSSWCVCDGHVSYIYMIDDVLEANDQ